MNEWPPFVPDLILAAICGLASVAIVFVAMIALSRGWITDSAMWAIAAMASAPAILGIGIASNMPRDRI